MRPGQSMLSAEGSPAQPTLSCLRPPCRRQRVEERTSSSLVQSCRSWSRQASVHIHGALLTKRETAVLERRAMGEITKQIGMSEGISQRTVREHFQRIKKKLYTDDLINAVVIAVKSGMLLPTGRNKGVSGVPSSV